MSGPSCYVIASADWQQATSAVAHAFLLCLFAVWAVGVDWWSWLERLHRHRRALRMRAIRARRGEGRA